MEMLVSRRRGFQLFMVAEDVCISVCCKAMDEESLLARRETIFGPHEYRKSL